MSSSYLINDTGPTANKNTSTSTTTTSSTQKKPKIFLWLESFKKSKEKSGVNTSQNNLLQNNNIANNNGTNPFNFLNGLQDEDDSNSSLSYTSETSSGTPSPPTSPPTMTSISPLSNSCAHFKSNSAPNSNPNSNTKNGCAQSNIIVTNFSLDQPPIPFPVLNNSSTNNGSCSSLQDLTNSISSTSLNQQTPPLPPQNKIVQNPHPIGKSSSFSALMGNYNSKSQQSPPPSTTSSSVHQHQTVPDRDTIPHRETKATKENFYKTIEDPKQFSKFKSYMENYQSMENLNFYLEIERYKKITSEDERRFASNDIWRRFFVEDGSSQLNLESSLKKRVEEAMRQGHPSIDLFDEVENQVLEDMVCDAFLHFLKSPFNQEWRVQPSLKDSSKISQSSSNNNLSEQVGSPLQQLQQQSSSSSLILPTSPVCHSQPISIPNTPSSSSIASNVIQSPTSPIQLSISIYSASDNPEVCQITKIDACDIEYILDEVMKNNISIHNEINYQDVSISHWLASGASGRVYLGFWKGKEVAVKIFGHEFNVYFDPAEYRREVALMTILKHDSLVQCFGSGSYGSSYFHLTEYCTKGSLTEFLKNTNNIMDLNSKITFALDIAYGMRYLHSMSIIHRDLKSMNILITDNNKIKIIDFGSSRITNKYMTSHVGTQAWMAPEIFTSKGYTDKVDVYSYGVILWEIFTRRAPYEENVPFNVPVLVAKGERPDLPKESFPKRIGTLIKKCWSHKPVHRPAFTTICTYLEEFIRDTNKIKNSK